MTVVKAPEPWTKHSGETETYSLDFSEILKGRTISSADSVTISPSGPTLGTPAVNSVYVDDDTGELVPASHAVTVSIAGGTDGTDYVLDFTVTLSDTSVKVGVVDLLVRDE